VRMRTRRPTPRSAEFRSTTETSCVIHEGPADVESRLEVFDFRNRGLVAVRDWIAWLVGFFGLCARIGCRIAGRARRGQAPGVAFVGARRRWGGLTRAGESGTARS